MKSAARAALLFLQVVFLLIAIWQIFGLLPVLTWLSPSTRAVLGQVTVGMWFAAGIKAAIMLVSFLLWSFSGKLRRKLNRSAPVAPETRGVA